MYVYLFCLSVPNISFSVYAPSFLEKFLESHAVMLQVSSIKSGRSRRRACDQAFVFQHFPPQSHGHNSHTIGKIKKL